MDNKAKSAPIRVSIKNVVLDYKNPRLALKPDNNSEIDVLKVLYDEFDLDLLARSFIENGYFQEEPIIVYPEDFSLSEKIFKKPVSDYSQGEIEKLISDNNLKLIVAEGNRRIATIKILLKDEFQDLLKINRRFFPLLPEGYNKKILEELPAIFYLKRNDLSIYLGVKHITGNLKWESYAKARYIVTRVEELKENGITINDALKTIQNQIGDRTDTIKKQYLQYKLTEEAHNELDFDIGLIKDRFSLLQVALNQTAIREYMSVPKYNIIDYGTDLINGDNKENIQQLLTWVFGSKDIPPIIRDSRQIQNRLPQVLKSEEATSYLLKTNDLEEAYNLSDGELEYMIDTLKKSENRIKHILTFAYKHKGNKIVLEYIDNITNVLKALKEQVL